MKRRSFCLAIVLVAVPGARALAADAPLRVTWITAQDASPSLAAGAAFGAAEARATAALFKRTFALETIHAADAAAVKRAAAKARASGATVIVAGLPARLAASASDPAAPLLTLLPRGENGAAIPHAWHIRPAPDAYARLLGGRAAARVAAWHPSLRRYGAGELNERYAAHAKRPMDEDAWLAWIAVKLAFESLLRGRDAGAARVDGHKGVLLRFDATRHLAQPLYVIADRNGKEIVLDE